MTQQPAAADLSAAPRAITCKQVCARISMSKGFVYKLIKLGTFPKPLKAGTTALWLVSEVDDWLAARVAERDAGQSPKRKVPPGRGRPSKAALAARAAAAEQVGKPDAASIST
jgi:prophage regulatory protein